MLSVFKSFSLKIYYSGQPSDHFQNGRFFNDFNPHRDNQGFFKVVKWMITRTRSKWNYITEQDYDIPPKKVMGSDLRVTNVGHATFLIQTEGLNILTDPIWEERASPFSFLGPRRFMKPGIKFDDLPNVDIVWISHNHYDHLNLPTIDALWKKFNPKFITPLGNDTIIKSHNKEINCEAYDWYQTVPLTKEVSFYLSPMQHWSARGLFDRNKALWASLTIKTNSGDIFFVGDTGYGNGKTFAGFKNLRLAILPIGAYKPNWMMHYAHMSPSEFFKAHNDLSKPYTIPSHYDVFNMADDEQFEASNELKNILDQNKDHKVHILAVGNHFMVPKI